MKKSLLLLAVGLFVVVSTGFSQDATENVKQTIMDMEKKVADSIKKGDWEVFESHLGEKFLSVYGFGISTKEQELESMPNLKMDTYQMSDVQFMQPADNVAIIAYKVNSSGSYMGEPFSGNAFATTTYVMQNGQWKGVMHTEVEAKEMDSDMDHDMKMEHDMEMKEDTTATHSLR